MVERRKGQGGEPEPEEFTLHSGRIGGATRLLAAGGVTEAVIKKEGLWASGSSLSM